MRCLLIACLLGFLLSGVLGCKSEPPAEPKKDRPSRLKKPAG
jgi:hypothetical protein